MSESSPERAIDILDPTSGEITCVVHRAFIDVLSAPSQEAALVFLHLAAKRLAPLVVSGHVEALAVEVVLVDAGLIVGIDTTTTRAVVKSQLAIVRAARSRASHGR